MVFKKQAKVDFHASYPAHKQEVRASLPEQSCLGRSREHPTLVFSISLSLFKKKKKNHVYLDILVSNLK